MKKCKFVSLITILCGILLMIGTSTIFKTCDITEKVMKCYWAGKSEIALGGILLLSGILLFISKTKETQICISILSIATSISSILIPTLLIGGCKKPDMLCRTTAYPCIYLIAAIVIILSLLNIALICKSNRECVPCKRN